MHRILTMALKVVTIAMLAVFVLIASWVESKVEAQSGPRVYLPAVFRDARFPPSPTTSRYISVNDSDVLWQQGCNQASAFESGIVILDFGAPRGSNPANYGASLFGAGPVTLATLKSLAQSFVNGYWSCSGSSQSIMVAMGTSNCSNGVGTGECPLGGNNLSFGHGQAWAQMVKEVSDWANGSGYASRVSVVGGNDIEPFWNYASVTREWVHGYYSVYNGTLGARPYYNFGSCDSCPYVIPGVDRSWLLPPHDWTKGDIWYVSWGLIGARPIPQSYFADGRNAAQWYQLALDSLGCGQYCSNLCFTGYLCNTKKMRFSGSLTQCQSRDAQQCPSTNAPNVGWLQLFTALNVTTANRQTAQEPSDMTFSTDITFRSLP